MCFKFLPVFLLPLIFIAGCSPEDGFCDDTEYSGGDDFNCSQMDTHFASSGKTVLERFTYSEAVFEATYLLNKDGIADSDSAVISKPDYMPEKIEPVRMSECRIAPSIGGIDCNQWYSFTFMTPENWTIEFSSRDGEKFSGLLSLRYCTFEKEDLALSGYLDDNSVNLNDTTIIDGASYNISHKYILIEKE